MALLNSRSFKLNTGASIPALGLGTWLSKPGEVRNAVKWALDAGYKHIDAAAIYNNETEVGAGIKDSGVPRSEIFLTSKLWNNRRRAEDVELALDESLERLGTDYLDLYLIHWPVNFRSGPDQFPKQENGRIDLADISIHETWGAMEALLKTNKVKAVGISNFNIARIEELLSKATVVPAVNQIEAHPFLQQKELYDYLKSKGIHVTAYSPLGNNIYGKERIIDHPEVKKVAEEEGKPVAEVLISWAIMRDQSVVPKSVTKSRIESNFQAHELSKEAFEKLNALERNQRYNDPIEWGYDVFQIHTPDVLDKAAEAFAKGE